MKNILSLILFLPLFNYAPGVSPQASPAATINQTICLTDVKIEY